MNLQEFRLIAPPHTPFHLDGSLNLDLVEKQAEWFLQTTVDGVFVAGSTGECQSMTTEERLQLAERWLDVAAGSQLEVIIQVGHNSAGEAQRMAAHAQQHGADAVAASAPCYYKPATVDDLIEFLVPIAQAAGDLPFYYYDIPPLTEVRLPMDEFLERGKERLPNLVGLKYSNIDLVQMQRCHQVNEGEFEILYGSDPTLLAGAALGACGAVGSSYNFAAPLYRRLLACLQAGDLAGAKAWQGRAVGINRACLRHGLIPSLKAVMPRVGLDCGPVRPPLRSLTTDQQAALLAELEALEIFAVETPIKVSE